MPGNQYPASIANVSQSETRDGAATGCDAGMESTTLSQVAALAAWFGALGVITASLNVFALHVVCEDEVPGWLQTRILWWRRHNPAFLMVSVLVTGAGLALLAATATR